MDASQGMHPTHVVRIEAGIELAEALESAEIPEIDALVVWHERATDRVRFESYHETEAGAEAAAASLRSIFSEHANGRWWQCQLALLEPTDWAESWKVHFRAERVSPRIVVKPTWEAFPSQPGDCIVELDPGMSFGTGNHFTTRSCLSLIDLYAASFMGKAVLDVGCGSGILGIAACKLGAGRLVALDNDPVALAIARGNAAHNGVDLRQCEWLSLDVLVDPLPGPFAVVVANLFAEVLTAGAASLIGALAPGGDSRLIISGLLCEQFPDVRQAYERGGLRVMHVLSDGEWMSAALGRGAVDG